MLFLQHSENSMPFVSFTELTQCFEHPQSNLRRSLSRRINSLRERLWPYGLDIVNVRDQGYTLLLQPSYVKSAAVSLERGELPYALSEGKAGVHSASVASQSNIA